MMSPLAKQCQVRFELNTYKCLHWTNVYQNDIPATNSNAKFHQHPLSPSSVWNETWEWTFPPHYAFILHTSRNKVCKHSANM